MVNKTLGYILAGAGLIVFLLSYSGIRTMLGFSAPLSFSEVYLMIAGIVLLLVGAFLAFKKSDEEVEEVPIYHGKKIVGYRVLSKK